MIDFDPELAAERRHNRRLMTVVILVLLIEALHALALTVLARRVIVLYLPARPAARATVFHGDARQPEIEQPESQSSRRFAVRAAMDPLAP